MAEPTFSRDELPTLVTCLACGGNHTIVEELEDGRYRTCRCPWCTRGAMTPEQTATWAAKKGSGRYPAASTPANSDAPK